MFFFEKKNIFVFFIFFKTIKHIFFIVFKHEIKSEKQMIIYIFFIFKTWDKQKSKKIVVIQSFFGIFLYFYKKKSWYF
jgi:hypothetical protein